ncbi:hypothetical protein CQA49_05310 [Helicobacter sp. MIT 00-7814]|nr:hypothetical protein CQA49_05310 [Helicobacter sp. MIT 00-7814]RDU56061.1 hypothetical protein CQA37_03110 [Helicobacter sp. MIT 99-10781]
MRKINLLLLGVDSQSAKILLNRQAQRFGVVLEEKDSLLCARENDEPRAGSNDSGLKGFCAEVLALFGSKALFGESLPQIALNLLKAKNLKLTTAESCTGGLLAYQFTKLSGASEVFDGGVISYANAIKQKWLKVDSQSLETFGAVSESVVGQMTKGALELSGADIALATSGIAGPLGGSAQKPVGLVFISVQGKNKGAKIERHCFKGTRTSIQKQACESAIIMLIREILES